MAFLSLTNIDAAWIQSLVRDQVPEDRDLDYKQEFPKKNKDFCVDAAAMSNAGGGLLIFGIEEGRDTDKRRFPRNTVGVTGDPDGEILRLEQTARAGIAPPIIGWEWKRIRGLAANDVVVLSVPRATFGLHMVREEHRFYSRTSAGNYPMSVEEIRLAFLIAGSLAENVRAFRSQRLERIGRGETTISLGAGAKMVLHLVPFESVDLTRRKDITQSPFEWRDVRPLTNSFLWHRFNLDGLLTWSSTSRFPSPDGRNSYAIFFRSGAVELGDAYRLGDKGKGEAVPLRLLENDVVTAVTQWFAVLRRSGIPPPVAIMLSLLNVGALIAYKDGEPIEIDRQDLVLPEVVIENYDVQITELLKPLFDALWQSCGLPSSQSYDQNGEWSRR